RRYEHAGSLDLDHADATDVHRRERVGVAERRRRDAEPAARVEDRRALGHAHAAPVDRELDELLRRGDADHAHDTSTPRFVIADATAFAAVGPMPQIDASRTTCVRSASTSNSVAFARPLASRCIVAAWPNGWTRRGTHCPYVC